MCENCEQEKKHEQANEIYKEALALANKTGEWFAVTVDGQVIRADLARGIPVKQYISPKLSDAAVR